MIIIYIFGWIFLALFIIGFITCLYFNWKDMLGSIKDFFYGLFTWQKKVPIYKISGSNQFSELFSWIFPDHYEWRKRETPKIITMIKNLLKNKRKY